MGHHTPSAVRSSVLGVVSLVLLFAFVPSPEPGTLQGTVTDADSGQPIPGANVVLREIQQGTSADTDGRYTISKIPPGTYTVAVTFIGFQLREQKVTIASGATQTLHVALEPASVRLDEVAVTAEAARMQLDYAGAAVTGKVMSAPRGIEFNTEDYAHIAENTWQDPQAHPLSTFSIDVDAASYSNVRRFIEEGRTPPVDAVRIEEMVNYFTYDYPNPTGKHPFSVTTEVGEAPWAPTHRLVHIGLQGQRIPASERPASNLVFLLDVSGSMNASNKLPLLKEAFGLLVEELRPQDRVAIVVYAGAAGLVLPSTPGRDKQAIRDAIARLESGGSTAGAAGIRLAYDVAREHHINGGINRVILATDGDFNVGVSSDAELVRLIEEKRAQGTFLTVLGFGTGNLKDNKMEQLADHGNGAYYYLDSRLEAEKVLVREIGSTLFTIAKDVKIQVEFNPAQVSTYRLIGYENRLLADEDFADDTKDAGELGAGHSVTALYEVIPVGAKTDVAVRTTPSLRYQTSRGPTGTADELLHVKLRYKAPEGTESRLLEQTLPTGTPSSVSNDFLFSSAVAAFGMILRDSEHRGTATLEHVLALARDGKGDDPGDYRAGFIDLVDRYQRLITEESPQALNR